MNSNTHIVPLHEIPQDELLAVLLDKGTATARTDMPNIDHVTVVVQHSEEECSVMTDEDFVIPVPTAVAIALSMQDANALDHVRSVLRAPFN